MPNENQTAPAQNDTAQTIEQIIQEIAGKPKTVTVDGQTVQTQSIADLIQADAYLTKKGNAAKSPLKCLHFSKITR